MLQGNLLNEFKLQFDKEIDFPTRIDKDLFTGIIHCHINYKEMDESLKLEIAMLYLKVIRSMMSRTSNNHLFE